MDTAPPLRLLYIEDNEIIGLLMQERLSRHGYLVDLAKDGEEGLTKLLQTHYDLAIVDYLLPGMSGLQVLQHLVEGQPHIPAIMVTGAGNEQIAVEVMKLGVGDYLVKDRYGHYFELLPSVIERILEKQRLIDEKKRIESALQDRDAILEAVSFAAEKFLTAPCWTQPIQEVLVRLGHAAKVSRAYIFKNAPAPPAPAILCYEWIADEVTSPGLSWQTEDATCFPRWQQILSQGRSVVGLVEELPAEEAAQLIEQHVYSIAITPVFVGKKWWGFIRYDDCLKKRSWSSVVIDALKTAASILGAAIQQKQTTTALQKSEEQVQTFVETANDLFCFRTLAGKPLPLNAACTNITGYSKAAFSAQWQALMHPKDLRTLEACLARYPEGTTTLELEYRLRTQVGQWRWMHSRMVGSQDETGRYIGYNCIERDITDRKQTEEALRQSEARLAQAQHIAHLGSWEWNVTTNNHYWSEEALKIIGLNTQESINSASFIDMIHSHDQKRVAQALTQTIQAHCALDIEFRILQPAGDARYVHALAKPVSDKQGELRHLLGTLQDITERKQAEEALRRSEQALRAILNATTDTIIMLKPEGTCVTINPTGAAILNAGQLIGQSIYAFLPLDIAEQVKTMVAQVVHTGEPVFFVDERQGIWFEGNFYPVQNDAGKVTHVVIFARDITERKLAEEALTHNEHALRAILNAVTDTVVLLEQNETCVVINPTGAAKLGGHMDDIVGHCIYDFLPQEVATKRRAVVEQVMQTKAPVLCEDERQGIWFEDNFYPVLNDSNEVTHLAIFSRDISERKQAEKALVESKRRYESIFHGAEVSIWEEDFYAVLQALKQLKRQGVQDIRAYLQEHPAVVVQLSQLVRVKDVNAATLRLLNAPQKRILMTSPHQFLIDALESFIDILCAIWIGEKAFQTEAGYHTLDGRALTVMLSMPIPADEEAFRHIPVSLLDITERKQAERKLRESEERYRQLFMGNTAVQWLIDPQDGRIIEANEAACRYYGYDIDTFKLMTVFDINLLSPSAIQTAMRGAKEKQCQQFFFQHRLASGEIREVEVHSGPISLEGRQLLYSIIHDVTERKYAEAALARTLAEQDAILDHSMVGIVLLSQDRRFLRVNRKFIEIVGYSEAELLGQTTALLYPSQAEHEAINQTVYNVINTGTTHEAEHRMQRKDGRFFWCRFLIKSIDPQDPTRGYIWNLEDVTEQRQAKENLRLAAKVFETTTEAIVVTDADNRIILANPAFTTITGYQLAEIKGKRPNILKSGRHDKEFYTTMWQNLVKTGKWQGEIWNRRKDGKIYVSWTSIVTIQDAQGHIVQHVGVFSDITQRKQAEELIWRQANYDALTNLPNRTLFTDRLAHALHIAHREKRGGAVMFIDLDRFKWVNDTLGHKAGDLLLQEAAQRLSRCVRESDTVARLGGDEFTVILPQLETIWDAKMIAERILNSLSRPFKLENKIVSIAGSIGITFFPEDGQDIETLLRNADMAMYQAKESGRNTFRFFTPDKNRQVFKTLPAAQPQLASDGLKKQLR